MNPLVIGLANAVQKMPVLEHFAHWCGLSEYKFNTAYYRPGLAADWAHEAPDEVDFDEDKDDDDVSVRRVYYEVGFDRKPNSKIRETLQYAGKEKYGEDAVENFLDRQYAVLPMPDSY